MQGNDKNYRIGRSVPLDYRRRPLDTEEVPEAWFLFTVPPQREGGAKAWFERIGAVEAWYPTQPAWRIEAGKRRRKVAYRRRIAPGYVFVLVDRRVNWDVLFDHAMGRVTGVVCRHGAPLPIGVDNLARMQDCPARLTGLQRAMRDRERAERLANQPRPGDRARVCTGLLSGRVVEIENVTSLGLAIWLLGTIRGTSDVADLQRLAG